jgi:ABC-type phosphate transport system ATPase subunit
MSSLDAPIIQVIDGAGNFHAQDLCQFATDNGLSGQKQDYQIVAIMGPQSSGKSTLLNHVVRFVNLVKIFDI